MLIEIHQINRINDERIAIGKSPVGFINPVLYEHPEVLNDSKWPIICRLEKEKWV
jgi:hypothetical protein